MPRETQGVTILGISLQHSRFDWLAGPEVQAKVEALSGERRCPRLESEIATRALVASPPDFVLSLTTKLRGMVADFVFWELETTFHGSFRREAEAEISQEDLLSVHGPAWLWSFAREYVADVTRRANIGPGVMLPPVNFQARAGT